MSQPSNQLETIGDWQITQTSSTIVSQNRWVKDNATNQYIWTVWRYREEITVTYEIRVKDSQVFPATVQDPGGLVSQGYRCDNRAINRQYGTPASSVYQEVYIKKGQWTEY